MIDQYGRTIEYLRISVTDRCNLRCVYCMPEEGIEQLPHEQILTFDEIERVCRISTELGISKIKLTGGEPLVRKGLPDLLGKIKRIPGIEQVTLTTNGILLKDQLNELMYQGLDAVNISIDTLDETCYHTVTRCGELNQALEGLQAALEYPKLCADESVRRRVYSDGRVCKGASVRGSFYRNDADRDGKSLSGKIKR